MIEWVLVVAPVAFSVLVFGLALGTEPIDVSLQQITTPSALEERGYAPGTIYGLLERKIGAIVDGAGSARVPERIEVGTPDTAINAYAEMVNVEVPVRATQRLLNLVNYVAEIHFVASDDKAITATLRIRDSNTLELLRFERIQGEAEHFEALLDEIGKNIVGFLDPYILSVYLYETSTDDQQKYQDVVTYAKQQIPVVDASFYPWFYNLLGEIAAESGDQNLAIEYYQEALRFDNRFYLAYLNWGHVLAGLGRQAEAIELYGIALSIKPDVPVAHVYLAEALLAQDKPDRALAELVEAEALAPEFAEIYTARATVLEQLGLAELARSARLRANTALLRQPQQNLYDTL